MDDFLNAIIDPAATKVIEEAAEIVFKENRPKLTRKRD